MAFFIFPSLFDCLRKIRLCEYEKGHANKLEHNIKWNAQSFTLEMKSCVKSLRPSENALKCILLKPNNDQSEAVRRGAASLFIYSTLQHT